MPAQNSRAAVSVQTEIIENISDIAKINRIGLPAAAEDTAVSFAGGKTSKQYLDGSIVYETELEILIKNKDQFAAASRLHEICSTLQKADIREISSGNECEIRSVSVSEMPVLKSVSDSGEWLYSCKITIKYLIKNMKGNIL